MKLKHILLAAAWTAVLPVSAQESWDLERCIRYAIDHNSRTKSK